MSNFNPEQCIKCQNTGGLVLSTNLGDYCCEYCGEWQDAILNDAWLIVGHKVIA